MEMLLKVHCSICAIKALETEFRRRLQLEGLLAATK
jgi:hypothetical protein